MAKGVACIGMWSVRVGWRHCLSSWAVFCSQRRRIVGSVSPKRMCCHWCEVGFSDWNDGRREENRATRRKRGGGREGGPSLLLHTRLTLQASTVYRTSLSLWSRRQKLGVRGTTSFFTQFHNGINYLIVFYLIIRALFIAVVFADRYKVTFVKYYLLLPSPVKVWLVNNSCCHGRIAMERRGGRGGG